MNKKKFSDPFENPRLDGGRVVRDYSQIKLDRTEKQREPKPKKNK